MTVTVPPKAVQERLHRGIVPGDERSELVDSLLARPIREPIEQQRAQAPVLPLVGDRDRDLRARRVLVVADEPGDRDPVAGVGVDRPERLVPVPVDLGQVLELGAGEARLAGQEPQAARFRAEAAEPVGD